MMIRILPFLMGVFLCSNNYGQYCNKTFRDGSSVQILNVNFGTINNTTTHDADDGYEDFTSQSTNVSPGFTYTVNIDDNTSGTGHYGRIYIDWNQDNDFDDADETTSFNSTVAAYSVNFTVPMAATYGSTRMRLVLAWNGGANTDACSDFSNGFQYGECEDYTLVVGGYPLPVSYAYYSVRKQFNYTEISWATLSEENNASFTIEKSNNGSNWADLTTIDGQVNSTELNEYTYKDFTPYNGVNFYRIKQMDLNGKTSFSEIKQVYYSIQGINYYPNPTEKSFIFSCDHTGGTLEVLNSGDSDVLLSLEIEHNKTYMNISSFKPGIYFIRYITESETLTYPLVKK